jgi:hypothetical protein
MRSPRPGSRPCCGRSPGTGCGWCRRRRHHGVPVAVALAQPCRTVGREHTFVGNVRVQLAMPPVRGRFRAARSCCGCRCHSCCLRKRRIRDRSRGRIHSMFGRLLPDIGFAADPVIPVDLGDRGARVALHRREWRRRAGPGGSATHPGGALVVEGTRVAVVTCR